MVFGPTTVWTSIKNTVFITLRRISYGIFTLLLVASHTQLHAYYDDDELDVEPARSGRPSIAIPKSSVKPQQKADVVDGKVLIKHVELKGTSLFPKYGVTKQYISRKLNKAYKQLAPWMSISDMHYLADTLTIAYQQKGLTFNQVFVVPSEIENNTLTLNVLTGTVSEITLKNNSLYKSSEIKKHFTQLLGKVVYEPDIQLAMKQANLTPGLKLFGFFSMGTNPGQTRLNLHVIKETKHQYRVRVDNYGVNDTGVHRVIGNYTQNNVSGNSDSLEGNIILTSEIGNVYGSVTYSRRTNSTTRLGAAFYSNLFEVNGDFEQFGLTGHLEAITAFHQKQLLKESNALVSLTQSLAFKHSEIRSDSGSDEINDILSENTDYINYRPNLYASIIWPTGGHKQSLTLGANLGVITKTNNEDLDDTLLRLDLNYAHEIRWQHQPNQLVTYLLGKAYFAPGVLPSSERAVMTGPNAVRAYKPALFTADTVYSLTLEQSLMAYNPFEDLRLLPFVFLDSAYGEQNDSRGLTESFYGIGIGTQFELFKKLTGSITVGFPLDVDTETYGDDNSAVIYGNMTMEF